VIALTRPVSPSLGSCELTYLEREPIDVARARAQHAAYEDTLASLGARIVRVAAAPELPDAVFIEDTALVLDEVALLTRPGAPVRRAETEAVGPVLAGFRPLLRMEAPATLDGGDVLRVGRTLYVGMTSRTNPEGGARLRELLSPFDYRVVPIQVSGCLHLKSAVTSIGERVLLLNGDWVSRDSFPGCELVFVARAEPGGANALEIGGQVIYPLHFPGTANELCRRGLTVVPVECGELAKAEGGVTCCSILFHNV
jgi:dimethylargininase